MSKNSIAATPPSLREVLPRIYELKAMVADPSQPHAYFQDFEDGLERYETKLAAFVKLERQLAFLDMTAWASRSMRGRFAPRGISNRSRSRLRSSRTRETVARRSHTASNDLETSNKG